MTSTPLTVRGFFQFPAGKAKFIEATKTSTLLRSLWEISQKPSINVPKTLPIQLKSKDEIYEYVKLNHNSRLPLKVSQGLGYAKELMNFYKNGIKNVWNNKTEVNELLKNYKISALTRKGTDQNIKIDNFDKLTKELALAIQSLNQLNFSRYEYQLVNRTGKDFYKIPLFVLICLIFAETTPLLCYALPQITPSTCVLPSILPRLWNVQASNELVKVRANLSQEELESTALKTAYNLPLNQVRLLSKTLRLTFKYIPIQLYPESLLRDRLNNYYLYLKVDNYFISGLNNGNVWDLSNQELINACLERNLIKDIKKDVENLDIKDKEKRSLAEENYYNELRLKLIKFIIDFENYNIGYLGLTHVIDQPNVNIAQWRTDKIEA